MTREQILEQIRPGINKYKKINESEEEYIDHEEMEEHKRVRWEIAMQDGEDPFKQKSIEELFNEWQWLMKYCMQYNK